VLHAVCFDVMDTVLRDPYPDALRAATGLDLDQLRELKDPDVWPQFELGAIDEDEFARRFFRDPADGRTFDLLAFTQARLQGYAWVPGMADLLDALAGTVERHAATNYPVWVEDLPGRLRFAERFEGVWASCHLGARKPDATFYDALLERVGHPPARCLFVDDRADNCRAAEAAGMRAHRFTTAADLRGRLRWEGIRPPAAEA
jgi:FMN hydrolase / 5-amino-6-(5-phospho-D-ribitylamino)uracil phosphatase